MNLDGNTQWPGQTTAGGGGGGGGDILTSISVTFAELTTAISGGTLVAGQSYLITDFATIYDQPDYEEVAPGDYQPKGAVMTVTCHYEPLVVWAISTTALALVAFSPSNPQDEIWYDPSYTATVINGSPAKGRITKRVDSEKNITMMFDWRSVTFKFYDHSDGLGYVWYWDDGSNLSSLLAPVVDTAASLNLYVGVTASTCLLVSTFDLPNFSINTGESANIQIMINSCAWGHLSTSSVNYMNGSVIGDEFVNNNIVVMYGSLIGENFSYCYISDINTCTIGNDFDSVIGDELTSLDLTVATIVYQNGGKTLMTDANGATWVTYPDITGVLQTVLITT